MGRDQEIVVAQPGGQVPHRAGQQPLGIAAADKTRQGLAPFRFAIGGSKGCRGFRQRWPVFAHRQLLPGQIAHAPQKPRAQKNPRGEFQRLKALEGFAHVGAGHHDSVIFQQDAMMPPCKGFGNAFAETVAAGHLVGGQSRQAAESPNRVQQPGVGHLPA